MNKQTNKLSKRFVFVMAKMNNLMNKQVNNLSIFPTVPTVQMKSSFSSMYYLNVDRHEYNKKSRKKRLYRRFKAVSALSGSLYQV